MPVPEAGSGAPSPGLCATCRHSQVIISARGSLFYLCTLSATRPEFARYPALPVLECVGFAERERYG